jgi:hypothetical protein
MRWLAQPNLGRWALTLPTSIALPAPPPSNGHMPCCALQAIRRPLHYALVDEVDSILIGGWWGGGVCFM